MLQGCRGLSIDLSTYPKPKAQNILIPRNTSDVSRREFEASSLARRMFCPDSAAQVCRL